MSISPMKKLLLTEQPQISQSEASQIGAATIKSETSLTASLRSSRSGSLATSFDKSAHRTPSTDRHLCNGVREQCFLISLNQTSPTNLSWNLLHQPNDILGQTSEQDLDDTSNESRSGQTMDVVSFPLPPPSTLTPTPPAPARRSMPSTMTPANPPCLTLPSTRTPASTQHLVLPSTMTPASTQHLGGGASDASTTGAALGFCLLGPRCCSGPPVVSRPTDENINSSTSLSRPRTEYFIPKLSFRLSPRSENSIADDLAKKAIWSMTRPIYVLCNSLFI